MPLVQWIMQNLTVPAGGVDVDGVALISKIMDQIGSGGVQIAGTAEEILIKVGNGVKIDGFVEVNSIYNVVTKGGVEVSGDAFVELLKLLRVRIPYMPGDQVYTAQGCSPYYVQSYFYDIDDRIKYEICNGMECRFVYDYDLVSNCETTLLDMYSEADNMINLLSQ